MENYENVDIKRILEIVFSKKIFIILILVISIALGYVYSYYYKKPLYNSSVKILLVADENKENREVTQSDLTINSSLISTYSSIAKSTNVIEKTIQNLELDMSVEKLKRDIEVTQISKTQFIKISVKNDSPEMSRDIANELAQVFSEQIKQIYNLENINIVDEAEIENNPCNVNHIKDMMIFMLFGIVLSAILVISIYIFDDAIKDENDIEQKAKLRNLGIVPINKENDELIIANNPKSYIVECIKTIRTNILYSMNRKTILITSCKQKEGKSWIINNIAIAFAQANKKVILVDADLRKQSKKDEIFNIEKGEGLSDFIKEITDDKLDNLKKSRKYIKETKISNLHIIQNGTIPPNPAELISSDNMNKLLDLLKSMYDIILLDGTSCMYVADSIALSSMVDSTILIVENKKTKIDDLKKTKKLIEDVKGNILGVISNKIEKQGKKYYSKTYGYYSEAETEELEKNENKQKLNSLEEIIKMAEANIKQELLNIKEEKSIVEENIQEKNRKINYQIKNVKNEILNEIKKLKNIFSELKKDTNKEQINKICNDINILKEIQENSNNQVFDKIENIRENNEKNITEMMQRLNEEVNSSNRIIKKLKKSQHKSNIELLEKIQNMHIETRFQEINNKLLSNREEYYREIEEIKIKKEEEITNIIQKFKEEIKELNDQIKDLKEMQVSNNSELLEKIEKIKNEQKIQEANEEIQENKTQNTNNIISFESLKARRKKMPKKVFRICENISYEELENTSNCIINLNEETTSVMAIYN